MKLLHAWSTNKKSLSKTVHNADTIGLAPACGLQARISHIQRMSTHDGPGIRTTLFFKGCPLKCTWCHNPETIAPASLVQWHKRLCIGCKICVSHCANHNLQWQDNELTIKRDRCIACGACVLQCPAQALALVGKTVTIEHLLSSIMDDETFYRCSGGGITASGGEPLAQPAVVAALFQQCQNRGIHTALDTSGHAPFSAFEEVLPFVNLLLFDLKTLDPALHVEMTGCSNELILKNLTMIIEAKKQNRFSTFDIWIRTPIVPGVTDRVAALSAIGRLIDSMCGSFVSRWELCSFNTLAVDKYRLLGLPWRFEAARAPTPAQMQELATAAAESIVNPMVVHIV